MEIKTKFNVGDKVWTDINGVPSIVTLSSIFIKFYESDDNVRISYGIKERFDEQTWRLPEDFFFLSKEKLIEKRNKQIL
jgi:hypothetical protein